MRAVASLPLERGRALGWGRSPFLGPQEGVGVVVTLQAEGLAKLLLGTSF